MWALMQTHTCVHTQGRAHPARLMCHGHLLCSSVRWLPHQLSLMELRWKIPSSHEAPVWNGGERFLPPWLQSLACRAERSEPGNSSSVCEKLDGGRKFLFFSPSASCRTNKPAFGDAKAGVNEAVLLSHGEVWWQSERQKKNKNGQQHSSVSISKQLFNNNLTGRRQRSSTNFYQVFLSVIHTGNYIIIQSFYPDTGVLI